jgi:hypothetical protein
MRGWGCPTDAFHDVENTIDSPDRVEQLDDDVTAYAYKNNTQVYPNGVGMQFKGLYVKDGLLIGHNPLLLTWDDAWPSWAS